MACRVDDRHFRRSRWRLAGAIAPLIVVSGTHCRAQSVDNSPNVLNEAEETILARQQWQERLRAEKRRIRELAIERRLYPEVETVVSQERRASERALNDMTLSEVTSS